MSSLMDRVSEDLLPFVQKPGQYIGREINQLVSDGDWKRADVRVAIAFPDTYTIGMSHLGCQIIYWLCNHTPGVCAERVYCPWIDAERVMRAKNIPLFTWDTRQPAADADIFAVSLQYEMGFTNLLTLLNLAGIPLRAADRDDRHPLVLAGGPQADNPEPVADFLDLVVIGDGEDSMAAILALYKELKSNGVRRRDMIPIMAGKFPWLYAPSLYDVAYNDDGTIRAYKPTSSRKSSTIGPVHSAIPSIQRCQTPDFENAPFPLRPLVPYVEVVHDRIGIEIMRGCPQRCRFCHAGYTKRPVGVRSVERLTEMLEEMYWATGHDEIGLLSLSTADYPHLRELAARVNERFAPRHVNISMPSLRVDKMLQNIPWMANSVRKSGLTIAVEAARDRMREAIRKKVTDGNLLDGMREVFKAGWRRVKCYFMVGFPGETDDDIRGIAEIAREMSNARRQILNASGRPCGPADITASVSFLVPKPFTPYQWAAQPRIEYFQHARRLLAESGRRVHYPSHDASDPSRDPSYPRCGATDQSRDRQGAGFADALPSRDRQEAGFADALPSRDRQGAGFADALPSRDRQGAGSSRRPAGRSKHVHIKTHDPARSILEAVFARGDRRLSRAIEHAWRLGARFDGWDECFSFSLWQRAFAETGIDPDWYAHRERPYSEVLPWDHIHSGPSRDYLVHQYDDVFVKLNAAAPPPGLIRLPVSDALLASPA